VRPDEGLSVARGGGNPQGERKSFLGLVWKVLVAGGGVALLVAGISLWNRADNSLPVEITAMVNRSELPITVTESGELESSKVVEVRCEVEGEQIRITEAIPEGTRVSKGQVVIRFDTEKLGRSRTEQEVKSRTAEAKAQAAEEDLAVAKNTSESAIGRRTRSATLETTFANISRDYQEKLVIEEKLLAEVARAFGCAVVLAAHVPKKGYPAAEVDANAAL
jgi:multidrug efflux pump subunit AcrA (membrane-fusion protein)